MTKYGRWEPPISPVESGIDPDMDGQLKEPDLDVGATVEKILNLIKTKYHYGKRKKQEENMKRESELVELVGVFYRQYQSLSSQYDQLKQLHTEKLQMSEKEGSSSSSSSSGSEYYSPDDSGRSSSPRGGEHRKMRGGTRQELEVSSLKLAGLRNKLLAACEEREALDAEYREALNKNNELEKLINDLQDESEQTNNKMQNLMDQINQLNLQLGERGREVSSSAERQVVLETEVSQLGEENVILKTKLSELQLMLEEREKANSAENLQQEVDSFHTQREKLRENMTNRSNQTDGLNEDSAFEIEQMKKEIERLKEVEKSILEDKEGLILQVRDLKLELSSLNHQKSELEELITAKSSENIQMRENIDRLQSNILNLEKSLAEKAEEFDHIQQELASLQAQNRHKHEDTLKKLSKKMEEMAEEFRKNIEDNVRILLRRIRVTEQLHSENKESFKVTKEQFELERKVLEGKIIEYSGIIETDLGRMKNMSEMTNNMTTEIHALANKFDRIDNFLDRVSEVRNELSVAKKWVTATNRVNGVLREEVGNLLKKPQERDEHESELREKIWELVKVDEGEREKWSLIEVVHQLEKQVVELESLVKEKDEAMVSLGEEKREAIRQLSMWIDYQHERYDRLKGLISELKVRSWKALS